MWSRNGNPVATSISPPASSRTSQRICVSRLFRSTRPRRSVIIEPLLYRACVRCQPFQPGEPAGGGLQLGEFTPPHFGHAGPLEEGVDAQRGGEGRGPAGRQGVVGPYDVVAQ